MLITLASEIVNLVMNFEPEDEKTLVRKEVKMFLNYFIFHLPVEEYLKTP